ncbi:hypothetical protein Mapa_008888 [Marchantia paleacea]|nr:hypothetical protein Mapa_008888 [Marchantia paleacea]
MTTRSDVSVACLALTLGFGFLLMVSPVLCEKHASEWAVGGDDCLYESREACTRADVAGCVWCDLPRRCYSEARSLELGEFCNRKKVKPFVEVSTCDEVLDQHRCEYTESCRWCKSEAVDDGCFSDIEAVRLPKHIFTCPAVVSNSGIVNVVGIGM